VIDPRALPFAEHGCVGAKVHRPIPLITEQHHVFPVYLQARVWDDVDPARPSTAHVQEKALVCGNCHATIHVVITALIQGHQPPARVATKLMELAHRGMQLYGEALK